MERRDYFKKQIDQLGRVLGKILADLLAFKNTANASEAIESAIESLTTKLDLDMAMLADVPKSEIVDRLLRFHGFNNDNLELLGDILLRIAEEKQYIHWRKLMEHSMAIFKHLESVDSIYSLERRFKINKIKTYGID